MGERMTRWDMTRYDMARFAMAGMAWNDWLRLGLESNVRDRRGRCESGMAARGTTGSG